MFQRSPAAFAAIILIILTSSSAFADTSLSGKAIRALFPGNYHAQAGGHTLTISANGNGALEGKAILGIMRDKGRWWVAADRLCVAFSDWLGGKPRCGRISKTGDWYTASLEAGEKLRFKPAL